MRVKLLYSSDYIVETRITPAHAGKTACFLCSGSFSSGSPPRMRVKLRQLVVLYQLIGITPAHAGKTFPILLI